MAKRAAKKTAKVARTKERPRKHRAPRGPIDIQAAEHEREALTLRKAGASYREIARRLDCSVGGAHLMVKRSFERLEAEVDETAGQVIQLEIERLDDLLLAVWPAARQGDVAAVREALRIGERRLKMLGLERSRVEHTGADGGPIEYENKSEVDEIRHMLEGYQEAAQRAAARER